MKNSQKGFIVPALLAVIVMLIIGGGVYVYKNKKSETPTATNNTELQSPTRQQTDGQNQQGNSTQVTSSKTQNNAPANAKPVISVISPNGGEVFTQNSPITVKWSQNFSGSASICLMGDAGCVYNSTPVMFSAGVNTLTIPANTNVATCTINNCYIANGYKVRVTTDNQLGSGHTGEFMNDESDNYFRITPAAQTGMQAVSFLQQLQAQIGTNYEIQATVGYKNISGYKISLPSAQFAKAGAYLSSKFGGTINVSERSNIYENWHIICSDVGLGAGASPTDLPYVWCADKIGVQNVNVTVRDIRNIDTNTRTFTLTLGMETMKVRMPAIVQGTNYQSGTFADFVKTITSSQFQTGTFQMIGQLNGSVFEVINIQWNLG